MAGSCTPRATAACIANNASVSDAGAGAGAEIPDVPPLLTTEIIGGPTADVPTPPPLDASRLVSNEPTPPEPRTAESIATACSISAATEVSMFNCKSTFTFSNPSVCGRGEDIPPRSLTNEHCPGTSRARGCNAYRATRESSLCGGCDPPRGVGPTGTGRGRLRIGHSAGAVTVRIAPD
jgi:hypothetical protein